jgi:hypothetical protein
VPISHQIILMQLDPGQHKFHLSAWELAFKQITIWNAKNSLELVVANVNMRMVSTGAEKR